MSVGSPWLLLVAGVAAVVAAALAWRRRRAALLLGLALFAAIAAAADVSIHLGHPPRIAVLIDASPSTRGLWFRDAATVRRVTADLVARLAPGASLRWLTFANGDPSPLDETIDELPAEHTTLPSVDADAIVLLSDGHFADIAKPAAHVPIFPVVGSSDETKDARILSAERDGNRVIVAVANDGPPRTLTWPGGETSVVPTGRVRLAQSMRAGGVAQLDAADRWPENDAVKIGPRIVTASERWWIGSVAPANVVVVDAAHPPPLEMWLAAREVVINNMSADALPLALQQTLTRYVRDLGGGLVIVGGDRAFSAGGYGGSELDALSPLASDPPTPRRDWLLLIDASGSMDARGKDGQTKLARAVAAADAAARATPAADAVAAASFARQFRPWPRREDHHVVPPPDLVATGPTNLRAALEAIIAQRGGPNALPLRVIALTDGDADLGDVGSLEAALASASVTVDWLALDGATTDGAFAALVKASGGRVTQAADIGGWAQAAGRAVRQAASIPASETPVPVVWKDQLADLGTTASTQANTTFLRDGATALATRAESPSTAIAARWRVGSGQVVAAGYAAPSDVVERLGQLVESPPRDPRFAVEWAGEHVTVTAAENGAAMNGLHIDVAAAGSEKPIATLAQTAPGRYEATAPTAADGELIATRVGGKTIDVHAAAAMPAEEFREMGVDRGMLERLANRTGGQVIDLADPQVPRVALPRRDRSLAVPLLCGAIASLLAALVCRGIGRR